MTQQKDNQQNDNQQNDNQQNDTNRPKLRRMTQALSRTKLRRIKLS